MVLYRSPTRTAEIYKKLKYSREGQEQWEKHMRWLDFRIRDFMANNENPVIVGDLNVDFNRAPTMTLEDKLAKELWHEVFSEIWDSKLENKLTNF